MIECNGTLILFRKLSFRTEHKITHGNHWHQCLYDQLSSQCFWETSFWLVSEGLL